MIPTAKLFAIYSGLETWYNVRKGQSQVSERTAAELARAEVRLDI